MPAIHESIDIDATPETIFDLIHDYSRRLEWDSFLRHARLLHGARHAAVGTTALCVARRAVGGAAMESV